MPPSNIKAVKAWAIVDEKWKVRIDDYEVCQIYLTREDARRAHFWTMGNIVRVLISPLPTKKKKLR